MISYLRPASCLWPVPPRYSHALHQKQGRVKIRTTYLAIEKLDIILPCASLLLILQLLLFCFACVCAACRGAEKPLSQLLPIHGPRFRPHLCILLRRKEASEKEAQEKGPGKSQIDCHAQTIDRRDVDDFLGYRKPASFSSTHSSSPQGQG